jgi:hypothetical protein
MLFRCLILMGLCSLGGCIGHRNDRVTLGRTGGSDEVLLAEFAPPERLEGPPRSDGPSVMGLARTNWEQVVIDVPVDGTYAFPRYARSRTWGRATARQRGDAVNAINALELDGGNRATQIAEVAAAGPLALWDEILLVPRFFCLPPWAEVRSLPRSYWRTHAHVPVSREEKK